MKLLSPLIILATAFATSCSVLNTERKIVLSSNFERFVGETTSYYGTTNVENISAKITLNANFLIYISEDGCSKCEQFKPILESYLNTSNILTYKFDVRNNREQLNHFTEIYGDMFFEKDKNNTYQIYTPSLYVLNAGEVTKINYNSYMQQENAFKNYMNSHYRTNNLYYVQKDISSYQLDDFTRVTFNGSDSNLLKTYRDLIRPYLAGTKRKVIVSSYSKDDKLHLKDSSSEITVYSNTSQDIIRSYF